MSSPRRDRRDLSRPEHTGGRNAQAQRCGRFPHARFEVGDGRGCGRGPRRGCRCRGTAQAQTPPPPIAVEMLTQRAVFTDDVALQIRNKLDGHATNVSNSHHPSRTVVARITVQPGAQFPWHTHPGPVIVNIAQGELTYVMAHDCVDRPYATDCLRGSWPRHGPHGREPNGRGDGAVGDLLRSATDGTVDHPRRGSGRLHSLTACGRGPSLERAPTLGVSVDASPGPSAAVRVSAGRRRTPRDAGSTSGGGGRSARGHRSGSTAPPRSGHRRRPCAWTAASTRAMASSMAESSSARPSPTSP